MTVTLTPAASLFPSDLCISELWFTNLVSGISQLRQFTLRVGQNIVLDGGFEASDFCYWTLGGDPNIYYYNSVSTSNHVGTVTSAPYDGEYCALLSQASDIAYLSQTLPTAPGQRYLLSFWLENPVRLPPNEFLVKWHTNSTALLLDLKDMGGFTWTNYQFTVTASNTVTTLEFGNRNDNGQFGLDDISVTPLPAAAATALILSASLLVTPPAPPVLQLSWTAVPGSTYQIQSTADLSKPASWAPLGDSITASTTNVTISTAATPAFSQFYRLAVLQ